MRTEHRTNVPREAGNVREAPLKKGQSFRCANCGEPATRLVRNAYRSSHVCSEPECRAREVAWVGNFSRLSPRRPGSGAKFDRSVDDRTLDVRTPQGRALLERSKHTTGR